MELTAYLVYECLSDTKDSTWPMKEDERPGRPSSSRTEEKNDIKCIILTEWIPEGTTVN